MLRVSIKFVTVFFKCAKNNNKIQVRILHLGTFKCCKKCYYDSAKIKLFLQKINIGIQKRRISH
jgi:hypothetical protein